MKKYLFLFAALLSLTFVGCEDATEDATADGAIELAAPTPVATTSLASATITWSAIAKCAGYSYSLDGGDQTEVDATILTASFSSLSSGEHSFSIKAMGDDIDTTDSQARTITFSIDPALAAPTVTYEVNSISSVTIAWSAIASAEGYNYKFNGAADWSSTNDLSVTFNDLSGSEKYSFEIYAVGDGISSTDSTTTTITISTQDTSVGVWVKMQNGTSYELTETSTDIYESTIPCSATDLFTILIEGQTYGFTPYSGNGGLGTVQNVYSTLPYSNDKVGGYNTYYIEKSVGRLSTTGENEGQNLWINMSQEGEFTAKVDLSYEDQTPRYRIDWVKDTSSVVLEQNFDLMVWGGEWVQYSSGRYISSSADRDMISNNIDGTEVASATAAYTALGMWITKDDYTDAYLANRDMTGWYVDECYEFPGYFRLSTSSSTTTYFGVLKTPTLAKLTGSTDVKFSFDAVRFASEGDLKICVLGAGTLSNVTVDIEGNGSPVSVDVLTDEDNNSYFLLTSTHCPKHGNSEAPKPWSTFSATITGATSATQVMWDSSVDASVASSTVRLCIDNILITK